jgi:hypothetical protein
MLNLLLGQAFQYRTALKIGRQMAWREINEEFPHIYRHRYCSVFLESAMRLDRQNRKPFNLRGCT